MIAGVLVPLEAGSVPDSVADLAGESPVMAQTLNPPYVVAGTPTTCPGSPWVATGSVCVLQTTACPASPLPGGGVLEWSVGYDDPDNADLYEYPGFLRGTRAPAA